MEIRRIGILGSGRLGRGIAENAASIGYDVLLFSQGAGNNNAPHSIELSLNKKLAKWALTESEKRVILSRIDYTSDLKDLANVDLVIEATIDHFYTKQELLRTADKLCPPDVIFILTSATLSVSDIARGLSRPDLLVGLHFIPPVPKINVVELSHGHQTSEDTIRAVEKFVEKLGKKVIHVKESPGLVNPRALITLINEGAYMVDEGVAGIEAVESILKESWSMEQGPFEMADRMGLDTILHWMEQLQEKFGDRYAPSPLIRRFVRTGRLGVKAKIGFFAYTQDGLIDKTWQEQGDQA